MTTIVQHVGHSFDDPEDQIARLFDLLARHTLDPTFEGYGDFISPAEPDVIAAYESAHGATFDACGTFHVWGNFADYSCVFNLYTDDPALIARLRVAVDANKQTSGYKAARRARRELEAWRQKREAELRRRLRP